MDTFFAGYDQAIAAVKRRLGDKIEVIEEDEKSYGRGGSSLTPSATDRIKHYEEVIKMLETM